MKAIDLAVWSVVFTLALGTCVQAQTFPAYPFSPSTDAVVADPAHHKVLFEDVRVRLSEFTLLPGESTRMNGHPYPAVIAIDAPQPSVTRKPLDPIASERDVGGGYARAPEGTDYPYCRTVGPEAPFTVTNTSAFLQHYYRIEFKRQDWPELKSQWKTWYPWMLEPLKPAKELDPKANLGPPFSRDFPFPLAYDSVAAAPNNHYLRYGDGHVHFVEVIIRPGETELMHGHPYPSVFARDGVPLGAPAPPRSPNAPRDGGGGNQLLVPPPEGAARIGGWAWAPEGFAGPNCTTMHPEPPHKVHNGTTWPDHFYRLEFVRLDGEALRTEWRSMYPGQTAGTAR
jgi:hypothetical protein